MKQQKQVIDPKLLVSGVIPFAVDDGFKLEQLQVLFRHGDRVADKYEVYEADPNKTVFEKYGYGNLTDIGKERVRKVGQVLRHRYDFFLGDYKPEDVYAFSSQLDRAQISLKEFLAGLYPSTIEEPVNDDDGKSSSIPIHFEKFETSFFTTFTRPAYLNAVAEARESPEILEKLEKYRDFRHFLQDKTGMIQENCFSAVSLYHNFCAAMSLGLPMPDWFSQEVFEKLKKIAEIFFESMSLTDVMKKLLVGPTIERIIENIKANESHKIHLYSGHDLNISGFLRTHNFVNAPKVCEFAGAVILEKLKNQDGQIFVRFFMWTGQSETWIPLELPGCDNICPLRKYEEIVEPILSTSLEGCKNEASSIAFPLANKNINNE